MAGKRISNGLLAGIVCLLASCGGSSSGGGGGGTPVSLAWDPPSQDVNGDPLTDLAGFRIYKATTPGQYSLMDTIDETASEIDFALGDGTYYFVVTAYDAAFNESAFSDEVTVTITDSFLFTP